MPGYVITSVFEVGGGKVPLGADVLAAGWGIGHRFSYCDGRMLTLVVELTAIDVGAAFESLLSRAELVWHQLGHGTLGSPVSLRVQSAVEPERVPAGIPPAEPSAGAAAAQRVRLGALQAFLRHRRVALRRETPVLMPEVALWVVPPDDEPPDEGGLAGVREPRRPSPAPPGLQAARDLPAGIDEAAAS